MGQDISKFGVTRPSFENPLLGEDEYRIIQASLDRAHIFSKRVERIIPLPTSYKKPVLALLPRL